MTNLFELRRTGMEVNLNNLKNKSFWESIKVEIPRYSVKNVIELTRENPKWVHFGAGNIFRVFIGGLQQKLLNDKKVKSGIIAVETFDHDIIDKIYKPYDNLSLSVLMDGNGKLKNEIIGSITDSIKGDFENKEETKKLKDIFRNKDLQIASLTITEKGYELKDSEGKYLKIIESDIQSGPSRPKHIISVMVSLLYERYESGRYPVAVVSFDNCSQNGKKLQDSILDIAEKWKDLDYVPEDFINYLKNNDKVSFPWSMIDKITPRPSEIIKEKLTELGIENMEPIVTSKNTYIAPYINAEIPEYLVIEDDFPNGRPPLEEVGVYLTDQDTVNKTEKMKVTACLNPLHTALAIFGCLLGYNLIADELKDKELKKLIEKLGYKEAMRVVPDPKIINPLEFIKEVIEVRFSNPYIPDTPQRIATDTSQKISIRFGETIKSYYERKDMDVSELIYIPIVIAGWCRYLLGIDDEGNEMILSPDPLLKELKEYMEGIKLGEKNVNKSDLKEILSNKKIFGLDLYEVGLGERVEKYFLEFIEGTGSVRKTLKKYLTEV